MRTTSRLLALLRFRACRRWLSFHKDGDACQHKRYCHQQTSVESARVLLRESHLVIHTTSCTALKKLAGGFEILQYKPCSPEGLLSSTNIHHTESHSPHPTLPYPTPPQPNPPNPPAPPFLRLNKLLNAPNHRAKLSSSTAQNR